MFGKRPSELTVEDLERVITEGMPEGSQLEFKTALPEKKGRPEPWSDGQDKVSEYARNELIAELIAFANAYGGWLLLGVEETKSKPRRAKSLTPIRDCAELAERLRFQCRDCVEPQIPILEVEGVLTNEDGSGVVVFYVPRSRLAPHRSNQTKECYVRRADRTEKMTMREIQDLTIQTERGMAAVEAKLEERHSQFTHMMNAFIGGKKVAYSVRATAIPTTPIFVEKVHSNFEAVRPPIIVWSDFDGVRIQFDVPYLMGTWKPILRGTECRNQNNKSCGLRQVYCDGLIENQIFDDVMGDPYGIRPTWIMGLVTNTMCAVELFRGAAKAPDVEYALDIEIMRYGIPIGVSSYVLDGSRFGHFGTGATRFPLYSLGRREEFPVVAAWFERDFWNAAGADLEHKISVDFDEAFKCLGI